MIRKDKNPLRPGALLMTNDFETGGSERQFALLARTLNPDAYEVHVGCLRRRGAFLEGIEDVAEFDVGGSFFNLQAQRARLALARHLRAHKVCIAHSFDFYSNLMLIPVARLAGVSVVIGSHRQIGNLLTPMQFGAQQAVFRLCDRVVCNSRAAAARLVDQGLMERKVVVIPNGLPEEAFVETAPAPPRSAETLRVGMIARMNDPHKNHPLFLRAAARLAPRYPDLEFLLAGDGPLRPSLEQMAERLGLGARVRFLGDRQDIPAVLAGLDVSVLTSSSESLSNAILESMAAGKPVVAARVGGNPELIRDGDTGFLIPADNEKKLVETLDCLLSQPSLRMEFGRRARRQALANYSIDRIRERYEQLYTGLLSEKGWQPHGRRPRSELGNTSPRPTRVAIVAASPRWIGGQGAQASLLMRQWQNDPDVEARFIPIDPELPHWFAWAERIPYLRTIVREPFYWAALWRGIKDADIAHIFSASYWSFLLAQVPAWLLAKLLGKKTLVNYHSGEARHHLSHWRTTLPVLRRASMLVVPSGYLVDVFREFGLEAKIVPNIVDLIQFSYRPRHLLRPLLLCTRGFGLYYGADVVVRAFAQVKTEFPEAQLCLVGNGAQEREVRDLVRRISLANVKFQGPVSHQGMGRFYDQADIFINASWLDNMPVSILEAFASGTVVVSTAPEGIRYTIEHEHTGLLCAPGDSRALAANVIRLLRDPDLASQLASNAYEESRRYRWEVVREQWLKVYQALQRNPHGRREEESSEVGGGLAPGGSAGRVRCRN